MALYAFDGTWNGDEVDEAKETNVRKFFLCVLPDMNVFYLEGVGTRRVSTGGGMFLEWKYHRKIGAGFKEMRG